MLEEVKIHDVGFLTFKLSGPWMIERIEKNLTVGIAAWAPIMPFKRVIIDFPHNDLCQSFRSICIRDVLVRMLEYCGVEVSGRMRNEKSSREVRKYFPEEEEGVIRSKKRSDFFFLREEEALLDQPQPNNIHEDLAALWCGGYEQKAQWIVYVTPVWQREYIMQCFNAAREFLDEHHTTLSYLGYETISDEEEILAQLLMYEPLVMKKESWLNCSGYSYEAIFEGTMKYAYLKTLTYSGCTLNALDLLNIEGDTFIHLLSVQSRIKSCFIRPHHHKSHKALSDREREVGLQLLQFTEIVNDSILRKMPFLLCEYIYSLSNNISSYILEDEFSESGVLLCKAAGVVMRKSFDLLGITPECPLKMKPYLEKKHDDKYQIIRGDHYISSSPPSRTYELRSRFEMFSMSIEAPFDEGNLFGGIMVTDTFGLRSDNWCDMDKKGRGQVDYFSHNWDDAVKFCDNSLITFGDRKCGHSVPFSSAIQIDARLWATSKNGESCYQLSYIGQERNLLDFWKGEESVENGTWSVKSRIGSLHFYYCLLREAVDTKLSLKYAGHLRVRGSILAYYGGGARQRLHQYKALIFDTESTNLVQGDLTLKRSMMAVPIDDSIVFAAHFVDVDTEEVVVSDKCEYKLKGENKDWIIRCNDNCRFTLKVEWLPDL